MAQAKRSKVLLADIAKIYESSDVIQLSAALSQGVDRLRFPSAAYVYNPLSYARLPHEDYLNKYSGLGAKTIFLGMNPGPFGMAQIGVPFGEIEAARTYLGISGKVGSPKKVHPKRRIEGFACKQSEVSGRRFWDWAKSHRPVAKDFFKEFFVVNYCPLVFMESAGKNLVPEKLPPSERSPLFDLCDAALERTTELLNIEKIIGIGKFAGERAKYVCPDLALGHILHPSPACPAANRGWAEAAEITLKEMGVI